MKRIISLILAAVTILALAGCSQKEATSTEQGSAAPMTTTTPDPTLTAENFTVPAPMATPVYTFEGEPTTDELRQTAVQAMNDLLSIQWCTEIEIAYYKTGPVSKKRFEHMPMNIYAGTIYSNASTGLFQFMEFYDQETGKFSYPGPVYLIKEAVGNSCADSLLWGYSTFCNSIQGGFFPATMVYSNGYLPVGNYTYDRSIKTYVQYPSNEIIKANGDDKILECYTLVQPADALVSTTANHAMMAIAPAHVEYNDDGTLSTSRSYITIQDQRGGSGDGFYDQYENGNVIHYSGRTTYDFTFAELLEKHYIPVTTAEFTGDKAYDKATCTLDNTNFTNLSEFLETTVSSNYPLAIVRATIITKNGTETVLVRELFSGKEETGVPRSYAFSEMNELNIYKTAGHGFEGSTIRIEAVVSTGEEFLLAEVGI